MKKNNFSKGLGEIGFLLETDYDDNNKARRGLARLSDILNTVPVEKVTQELK